MNVFANISFLILTWVSVIASSAEAPIGRFSANPDYPLHIVNNQEHVFSGEFYSIVSHVSGGEGQYVYDRAHLTEPGVQAPVEFSTRNAIPSIGIVSENGGPAAQFFRPNQVTYVAQSHGGQHRFSFPDIKTVFIGGGNLSLCLCEVIRDVIRRSARQSQKLKIVLVTDAIYDWTIFWPFPATLHRNVNNQYVHEPLFLSATRETERFLLSEVVELTRQYPDVLINYFKRGILAEKEFCPDQNTSEEPPLVSTGYNISVYVDDLLLTSQGSIGLPEVEFKLVESTHLEQILSH